LGDLDYTLPDVSSIIKGPQLTLRRFQLRNVSLEGETPWPALDDKLGELLKLHHVTLLGLVSDDVLNHMVNPDIQYENSADLTKRMMA